MKSLAILGASGHGKVVADCAQACGWQSVSFYDDRWPGIDESGHWAICGTTETLLNSLQDYDGVIVAIGDCVTRLERVTALHRAGALLVSLVHPSAVVSPYALIGEATVVFAGAVVNVDARLGDAVIINTGASVDHDCIVGDGAHISPGARLAGSVIVGELAWVGVGASVRQGIAIGAGAMVGAGAAVVSNVDADFTVVGVPARPLMR